MSERGGRWARLRCRLIGHEFYWLDYQHQCHCRRCGKRNDRHFRMLVDLETIKTAGRKVDRV